MVDSAAEGPIRLMGDTEEMAAARGTAPAHTLLREHLDWWLTHEKNRPTAPPFDDAHKHEARIWHDAISISVEGYNTIYLMAVLHTFTPVVANIAARNLFAAWDSGELGEWAYQWSKELTAGQPLTLYGIPDAEPLAPEHTGGFPTATNHAEPTPLPTAGMNFVDQEGVVRGVTRVDTTPNGAYRVEYLDGEPEFYAIIPPAPLDPADA